MKIAVIGAGSVGGTLGDLRGARRRRCEAQGAAGHRLRVSADAPL